MATADQYIGRREAVGLGIEGTPGTAVDSQIFVRWLTNEIQNKTDVIENESAMGVVDKVSDSEVVAKYVDGKLGGKVTNEAIGFLLTGFFGSPTTGTAVSGIYPHTFTMSQSSVASPTLSVTRLNPVDPQRHAGVVIDSLQISAEKGGWVEVETAIKGRVGSTVTELAALVAEKEFTSKHITVKLAVNTAGLTGATALDASKVTLTLDRPSEMFIPLGSDTDAEFDRGEFTVSGELVLRYTDSQYEADYLANTIQALEIAMTNGDESLTFTAGQIRYRELERSTDRDGIVTQTLSIACELEAATSRSIQAVLKNGRATYEAN